MYELRVDDEDGDEVDFVPSESVAAEREPSFNWRLCLVGRFIQMGSFDFAAMQQTLASL